jgi:HlyD family secretion protein
MEKKTIAILIIVAVLFVLVYNKYFGKKEDGFNLAEVVKGNVVDEVSETGQVKKGDALNLGFKSTGIIENIYVEIGEEVKAGDILAKIENSQLKIQLQEAAASLDLAQAQLDKLLIGASQEDIQVARTSVENAKTSLETAKKNLEDIKAQGDESLRAAYEDALNVLDDSYLKIFSALDTANSVQAEYFTYNDQESIQVKENRDKIQNGLNQVKLYLDAAKDTNQYEDIDRALSEAKNELNISFNSLKVIRDACEGLSYKNIVSSDDKTSLDTQRGYVNTALTNIVNSQQTISSAKLTNTSNINTYQGKVDSAEGQLKTAEDELAKITAPPREEDIDLYQAQVKQARAKVQILEQQIGDTILKSPIEGQVVQINKRVGEIVQPTLKDGIITLLPAIPFEIEADIYEEDVAKMSVGNEVKISLVAFPDQDLQGKVVNIDPSEKIIDGIVYYEASISFDNYPSGVKAGMTADLIIKVASKENVLVVPEDAITKKNGIVTVQVLEGDELKEREIKIGLEGSDYLVEVVSGLKEGDEVSVK